MTPFARIALLCLVATASGRSAPARVQDVKYMGRAYLFQADLERARTEGWIEAEADADEILDGIRDTLEQRVRSVGMFPEARVEREDNGQFAVVFVGRMAQPIESFLQRGLSNPGRIAYRVLALSEDLGGDGDLNLERGRLDRWVAEHPEQTLADFNRLPNEKGGPHAAILWLPRRPRGTPAASDKTPQGAAGEPLALLRGAVHEFHRDDMGERGLGMTFEAPQDTERGLMFELEQEHADELQAFGARNRGRRLAFVVNDRVVELRDVPESFENPVSVDAGLAVEECRELILAVTGGPLQAPLTFAGFDKRPLHGVKTRSDEEPAEGPDKKGGE